MIDSYLDFPIIEMIEDNYGYSWRRSEDIHNYILTEVSLKPGDLLTIKVTLEKPLPEDIYYCFQLGYGQKFINQKEPCHTFEITKAHVSRSIAVYIRLTRKQRDIYLQHEEDEVQFRYMITAK